MTFHLPMRNAILRFFPAMLCSLPAWSAELSSHAPQEQIGPMLQIDWKPGTDLPQGFQDSDGGFIDDWLITVGGFCSGGLEEDNRRKPGRYPRGFLKKVWGLDMSRKGATWETLPDFPGDARQGLFAARVDNELYLWGGFSYTKPFCYRDGYKLARSGEGWSWSKLPALPHHITTAAIVNIGPLFYIIGGADYDGVIGFYTEHDREGKVPRLGARMYVLDTRDLPAGFKELPQLPGTARFVHAATVVDGRIYVIGGATGDKKDEKQNYGYCTVVDNWRYDPGTREWTRLRDLAVSSGNFPKSSNLVYRDRYIILPGGHQYAWVCNPDGSVRPKYGHASQRRKESGLHNDCFVYDTKTGLFGTANPLPIDNNLPMTVVRGDEIYLIGGETGGGPIGDTWYGHHPDLLLVGKIREVPSR